MNSIVTDGASNSCRSCPATDENYGLEVVERCTRTLLLLPEY